MRAKNGLQRIVFRGDREAYVERDGRFPYVDHAAEAGATGIHIWFWGEPLRRAASRFFPYCRDRGMRIHLGIGVGSYDVCEGEDPTDPKVLRRICDHIARSVEEFDIAGIEFQTGEYDDREYKGQSIRGKSLARQVAEQLNSVVDFTHGLDPQLWLRTELHSGHFDAEGIAEIAAVLNRRCTVEWSRFTGPYQGRDAFGRGRALLEADGRASWFLKVQYNRRLQWKDIAVDDSPEEIGRWIEHWRGWTALLEEYDRSTLTICNVSAGYVDSALPYPAAAVALAKDPALPAAEVLEKFFGSPP